MAAADVERKLFFCHECSQEIYPTLPDYTCSECNSGFIEEMEDRPEEQRNSQGHEDRSAEEFVDQWENMFVPMISHRGRRRRHHHGHPMHMRNRPGQSQVMFQYAGGGTGPSVQVTTSANGGNGSLDGFLQQLVANLSGQLMGAPRQLPGGNLPGAFGDYAWGPNGFDNIITELMNQLGASGVPPAEKTQIDSLPVVTITQKNIDDKIECAVCREEYTLVEEVKKLPCAHVFHPECVDPWLELHNSCPICRCNLNGERPPADS